jgi:hypothetical protein
MPNRWQFYLNELPIALGKSLGGAKQNKETNPQQPGF